MDPSTTELIYQAADVAYQAAGMAAGMVQDEIDGVCGRLAGLDLNVGCPDDPTQRVAAATVAVFTVSAVLVAGVNRCLREAGTAPVARDEGVEGDGDSGAGVVAGGGETDGQLTGSSSSGAGADGDDGEPVVIDRNSTSTSSPEEEEGGAGSNNDGGTSTSASHTSPPPEALSGDDEEPAASNGGSDSESVDSTMTSSGEESDALSSPDEELLYSADTSVREAEPPANFDELHELQRREQELQQEIFAAGKRHGALDRYDAQGQEWDTSGGSVVAEKTEERRAEKTATAREVAGEIASLEEELAGIQARLATEGAQQLLQIEQEQAAALGAAAAAAAKRRSPTDSDKD